MRIGFIGCGAIFSHYASIIKDKIEGMEIVAICDTDESKRSIAQKIVTANFYDNVQNMIDSEKMDACFILSPSGIHYEHGKVCLESGVNTFIEKPIALKIDHAIELNELAKKQKVALGVIYQNRFNKAIQFAKKLIDKNLLGKRILTNVRLLWSRDNEYYKGWRGTWEMDGVLCSQTEGDYVNAVPQKDMIKMLNKFYNEGYKIIIYTSRYMGRNSEDIIKTYKDGYEFTFKQLKNWGIKFHELFLGKPRYDILIDDRSVFFIDDPEKIYSFIDNSSLID